MIHPKAGLDLAYRSSHGNPYGNVHMGKSSLKASAGGNPDPGSYASSFHEESQPLPPPLSHPPPPALKQAVPHHQMHHLQHLRAHDLYAPSQSQHLESSPYLLAAPNGDYGSADLGQGQLTDHLHHHRHHLHQGALLPPPPVLQQQQPSSSSSSIDPYQDYFQSGRSYGAPAYEQVAPQADLRYNFHDFSGRGGSGGINDDSLFFSSASTPVPGSSSQLNQFDYLQHFQPSPAVLLHIRYVMESICEWMQFTDVTIVTATERVRAHRAILASHSSFLRQLMITNLEDLGENEEPVLVIKDMSSAHMRLMMQFFYNGEVSLSSQDDIQPLKDVCYILGVSSLMARLDELSFSLQCLPNYDDPFKYGQRVDNGDVQLTVATCNVTKTKEPMYMPIEPFVVEKQLFKSCAKENAKKPSSTSVTDAAANNFDTYLLNDDHIEQDILHAEIQEEENTVICTRPGKVKKKTFSCLACETSFYTRESLVAHERVHEGKKPFSCEVCESVFSTKSHLQAHMIKHSGDKPFSCNTCQKTFGDRSALRRHEKTHGDKKDYECEVCKKSYSDRSTFRRHFKEKHNDQIKLSRNFECSICKKIFRRRETMVTHVVRVHGKDLAKKGGKKEFRKESVEKYLPKKEDESSKWSFVKCPQCSKTFYKKSSMEIHLRSHTGDKPYVCELCGKKFARSNNLKLHNRIHTGEKPHKCTLDPECAKAFSDISALKRHLRTHTGERPYECNKCHRTFSQMGTMKGHAKNCKGRSNEGDLAVRASGDVTGGGRRRVEPRGLHQKLLGDDSTTHTNPDMMANSMMEDNSLSVMAGSEPPIFNTDTLDSVRASCI